MLLVHHLQVSQSERVVWLCEELGIDYDLKLHKRSPIFSPPEMHKLHPLAAAPIIQDGDVTLAETVACFDWIVHKHANGRLYLPPSHPKYADFLYWFHFVNGSLHPGMSRLMTLTMANVDQESMGFKFAKGKFEGYLKHVEERLSTSTWLAGEEFTAADCMLLFTPTTMRAFYPFDLSPYPNILAYIQRCVQRPAYKRYKGMADPDTPDHTQAAPPQRFTEWKK